MLHLTQRLFAVLLACALSGCMTIHESTPLPAAAMTEGLTVVRELPDELPSGAAPFRHSQFVVLKPGNLVQLASPIPFVADLATQALHQTEANAFESRFASVHPYRVARAALEKSPLLSRGGASFKLKPFVFLQHCSDGRYRLAYTFEISGQGWVGRYLVHLKSTYAVEEFEHPTPELLATLERELTEGANELVGVVERDARGQLAATGPEVSIGSLHLVGEASLVVLSPSLMRARHAVLVDESAEKVIVRLKGNTSADAAQQGLFFGVHILRKDQLEVFHRK